MRKLLITPPESVMPIRIEVGTQVDEFKAVFKRPTRKQQEKLIKQIDAWRSGDDADPAEQEKLLREWLVRFDEVKDSEGNVIELTNEEVDYMLGDAVYYQHIVAAFITSVIQAGIIREGNSSSLPKNGQANPELTKEKAKPTLKQKLRKSSQPASASL